MASVPLEVLFGLYLGVLIGIVPALVAWGLGFVFKYVTGVTIPALAVVVLSVAIAGANGGLLALIDPSITASENQLRLTVALLVVLMIALYAHNVGDRMAIQVPRRLSLRRLTERTLSTDVVELVGGRGQVEVRVAGEVGDIEGYPALPADLRATIRRGSWTFPADLPLPELESRLADRLRTEYDLADALVRIDERARATISAAPPIGGLSKRVPVGKRAVSLSTLVPTGLAPGDEVEVHADDHRYRATVLGVRTPQSGHSTADPPDDAAADEDGDADLGDSRPADPAAVGGAGSVTVAVDRSEATQLLASEVDRIVVRSRGKRREFELVSLLRRAGQRFRKLTVREAGALDGTTLGDEGVRDTYGVAVLAVRHGGEWTIAPRGSQELSAGDDLFAVGRRENIAAFQEAAT